MVEHHKKDRQCFCHGIHKEASAVAVLASPEICEVRMASIQELYMDIRLQPTFITNQHAFSVCRQQAPGAPWVRHALCMRGCLFPNAITRLLVLPRFTHSR